MRRILLVDKYSKEVLVSKCLVDYLGKKFAEMETVYDTISFSEFLIDSRHSDYTTNYYIIFILSQVFDSNLVNLVSSSLNDFEGKLIFHCLHLEHSDILSEITNIQPISKEIDYSIYLTDTFIPLDIWQDLEKHHIYFSPNILSFYMKELQSSFDTNYSNQYNLNKNQILIIPEIKTDIVSNFSKIIANVFSSSIFDKLFHKKSNTGVISIPIDTNSKEFSKELQSEITDKVNYLRYIDGTTLNLKDIIDIAKSVKFCITTGYYGTLICLNAGIPFFPIYLNDSVKYLLDSRNCPFGVQIKNLQETKNNLVIKKFHEFHAENESFNYTLPDSILLFQNKLLTEIHDYIEVNKDIFDIYHNLDMDTKIETTYTTLQDSAKTYFNKTLTELTKEDDIFFIARIASYLLTNGRQDSPYLYGLASKLCNPNFDYKSEFKFVINDYSSKYAVILPSNVNGIIKTDFIDQWDYNSLHRSGWQYVFENLINLNNRDSDLLCDFYLDRTFGWNSNVNKISGIIPFKKSWVGFIHHTFENDVTDFNCNKLFKNKDFIKSLSCCKALLVLSDYLKNNILQVLKEKNIENIKVFTLMHPTESVPNSLKFNWKKFIENPDKKVIHVGGWLRNIYFFYRLEVPSYFSKVAFKWKFMNNYFPSDDFKEQILSLFIKMNENLNIHDHHVSREPNVSCDPIISCNPIISFDPDIEPDSDVEIDDEGQTIIEIKDDGIICSTNKLPKNTFLRCFLADTNKMIDSVELYTNIQDSSYDEYLLSNIVLINLIDASAVNAIIECIVRNCPILVNRHPAVIEVLGEKYPLLYDTQFEAESLLSNLDSIKDGYNYLVDMDKTFLKMSYFKNQFVEIIKKL